MAYIQLDDRQFPLDADETLVGAGEDAHIRVGEGRESVVYAVVARGGDGTIAIRRGEGGAPVRVNGVGLGIEPVPLVHGDKVEVAGRTLIFGDEPTAGSTRSLESVRADESLARSTPARSVPSSNGRLVSLVDGREYAVPAAGLVIGRDPSCDVVVASSQVSRRHAVVAAAGDSYVLTDTSTNGVEVNGEAVAVSRQLSRGDVLKIGGEEFRFHADLRAPTPAPLAEPVAAAAGPPALASLEVVNEGLLKGRAFDIRSPLAHIGRGAHNDVVITDSSVSETHAKLQRRETGWVIVDMDSTNGTYVGGRRINGEQTLVGMPDVRFGNVKCVFRVHAGDAPAVEAHGTRVIAPMGMPERVKTPASNPRQPSRSTRQVAEHSAPEEPASRGVSSAVWLALVLAVAAGVIFILTSR